MRLKLGNLKVVSHYTSVIFNVLLTGIRTALCGHSLYLLMPGRGASKQCVSFFVCLSVCSHKSRTVTRPIFTNFLCMLPVAMAPYSTDGVAIC